MKRLTALLLAVIGAAVFALTGCSNGETFTEKSYSTGEKIEKITVEVTDRELEVGASEDDKIHIEYFDGEKEYLDITVSENKELTVRLEFNKEWTDYIGKKASAEYRKIKIKAPDNLLCAFTASTTNEDIKISPLSLTEHISLNSNGGNIEIEGLSVGKSVSLTAKNGNIKGSVIGGYDDFSISCRIKKGDCNLPALKEGGEKSFFADCNNGDIDIEFITGRF